MTGKDFFKLVKIVGGIMLLSGAIYTAWPRTIGDYPPVASRERVEAAVMQLISKITDASRMAEAATVRGNILGAWRACRNAVYAGDKKGADDSGLQLAVLQEEYMKLTDGYFPTPACP